MSKQKHSSSSSDDSNENRRRLFVKLADEIAARVQTKGGLSKCGKVWATVAKSDTGGLAPFIIESLLNGTEFSRLDAHKYQKTDIAAHVLQSGAIFKSKVDGSTWKQESREVQMGNYETRFYKLDPQTGSEIPSSVATPTFSVSYTDSAEKIENATKKFAESLFS